MSRFVSFSSPKGGVGRTTLVAHLAGTLAQAGLRVLALDLDVQNALRLPFGMAVSDRRGLARCVLDDHPIRDGILPAGNNLLVLPFGRVNRGEFEHISVNLAGQPGWLGDIVAPFLAQDFVVIADTSAGFSPFLQETRALCDLDVVVLQPDAASLALLPRIEVGEFPGAAEGRAPADLRYVFNMADQRRKLVRDTLALLGPRLGERLLGVVAYDDCFGDAFAYQQLVIDYAPTAKAAHDLHTLSAALAELLSTDGQPLEMARAG